jgi:hypothetical protein
MRDRHVFFIVLGLYIAFAWLLVSCIADAEPVTIECPYGMNRQ